MNTGTLFNSPLIKSQSSSCSVSKFNTPLSTKVTEVVYEVVGEIKEKQLRFKVSIKHIALLLNNFVHPLPLPFLKDQSSIQSF
jgi:hypothetical protein